MAELAAGAVSSLLAVIRNEMALLGGVHGDVQFIKEEMESMSSFLVHLARTAPPGGEHDEQVRTWMNQVRLLAQDCNNCLDLYLYRGNPEIHRARGGLRRYLWWVPWFLQKLVAQHHAAIQLRRLKDRAQHVGERRLRYGVSVPGGLHPPPEGRGLALAAAPSSSGQAATSGAADDVDATAGDDEEEDDGGGIQLAAVAATTIEQYFGPRAFFQPGTLDDYVKAKLLQWVQEIPAEAVVTLSLAIVAPEYADQEALALAYETLVHPPEYNRGVLVDITAVHHEFLPLRPKEVLYYILREVEQQEHSSITSRTQHQEGIGFWQAYRQKWDVYNQKRMALQKIKDKIQEMMVCEKFEKIKKEIQLRPMNHNQLQQLIQRDLEQNKGADQLDLDLDLHVVFQLLHAASQQEQAMKSKNMPKLSAWYDGIVKMLAKKLKRHMEEKATNPNEHREANDKVTEGEGGGGGDAVAATGAGVAGEDPADATRGREANEEDDDDDDDGDDNGDDERQHAALICLSKSQYEHILRDTFPNPRSSIILQAQQKDASSAAKQSTKATNKTTLDEDQVKQMIHDAKEDILRELQQGKADKNQTTEEPDGAGPKSKAALEGMDQKIEKLKKETKEKMKIKGLVDEIKHRLKEDIPLFILKIDEMMDGFRWEDTRNALSLLKCSADALIFTTTNDIERARGFCYPRREPIDYSPVGLYHDTVFALTSRQKNEDNYDTRIFRDILEECRPHEFCMKIFTHAFYANPKRSTEELHKLHSTLQAFPLPKSLNLIAKKMFKFSYNDLPKEYKACLLYLAIFPPEHKIRRSTLVGRWVTEGLIFHDDWPNSVHWANRCFDELINRWLVYPSDIGATGKVKSCIVGDLIHGFITKVARKQHIVETRLSHHLARHFSIFNDLRLRSSDRIDKFFQLLSESSQVSLLKVLDLEECQCFGGKKQSYLKVICSRMLLLKYLSLKGTDATHLPAEINNLRELEVLDIRGTKVPESATINVLLLKLKSLLAGGIICLSPMGSNMGSSTIDGELSSSVYIPENIEKMVNVEVLSHVKASNSQALKDIGRLCLLRKLGVFIYKETHLNNLLRTINDLQESLRSLSITIIPRSRRERDDDTPPQGELQAYTRSLRSYKLLESLSITGTTQKGHLLPLFVKHGNNKLAKVTLSSILLKQDNLKDLARLPKLQYLRLRNIACVDSMLTFSKAKDYEFRYLKYLLVEGSDLNRVVFEDGGAPDLQKLVLSFTNIVSIHGADILQKLEELELNNNKNGKLLLASFDSADQIAKLTLRGTLLEEADLQILAKKPKMRCLVLLDKSCAVSQITFNKDMFVKLNLLTVHCSCVTEIIFDSGSAPKLEKIIWSSFKLSGIDKLPRLKELEFNGDHIQAEVEETVQKSNNILQLKHNRPDNQDEEDADVMEDDDSPRCSFCWKNQV